MTSTDEKQKSSFHHRRFILVMLLLESLLLLGLVLNVSTGSVTIPPGDILRMLWNAVLGKRTGSTQENILLLIRLPRLLLAGILGGALAVSGFLLQSFFRNPIAGPFVLGISNGAKMVVGLTMIFFSGFLRGEGSFALVLAAFVGALMITLLVLLFSQKVRNMSMLLVVGIMVSCDKGLRNSRRI